MRRNAACASRRRFFFLMCYIVLSRPDVVTASLNPVIELYGINTSFEDAKDAKADQTICYWLDGLRLGRRQAPEEVSRWLYFQNSQSTYFVEIEETDCCCKIGSQSRIPSLLGSNSRSARMHIPASRNYGRNRSPAYPLRLERCTKHHLL